MKVLLISANTERINILPLKITSGIRIYPQTALARVAIDAGMISPDDDLLLPKFYLVRELEEWLLETVKTWMADRPHWMT